MSNATLEVVEYAAWHLAAEPSPERMEALLDVVRELTGDAAETPQVPAQRVHRVSPVPAPETRDEAPEDHPEPVSGVPAGTEPDYGKAVVFKLRLEPKLRMPDGYDGPAKRCVPCDTELPATPEFFTRDRTRFDGLRYRCKACDKAVAKPRDRSKNKTAATKD